MDKIDEKILLALDKNPRASFNQIGKAVRISKEVAQYRFKQLQKNNIITGFFAFIDVSKLGYQVHKILIKYKRVNKITQGEIVKFLQDSKYVSWSARCEGSWDLIITNTSPSLKDFVDFYSSFLKRFGQYFGQKEVLIPIENPIFNDKYLSEGKLTGSKTSKFHNEKIKIDEVDKKILTEISLNSRITFTDLGQKVNLTYWAVSQRYKKLVKNKTIISLKPRINFKELGYEYYHLLIESNDEASKEKIIEYYTNHKSCVMLMSHIGKYSLHLELIIKKNEMQDILFELMGKFGDSIISYEPLLIVEEYSMNIIK